MISNKTMAKKTLYASPLTGVIENGLGEVLTPLSARVLVETGKMLDCNIAFQRLMQYDYDVRKFMDYYKHVDS
jgi:hypothetical protein